LLDLNPVRLTACSSWLNQDGGGTDGGGTDGGGTDGGDPTAGECSYPSTADSPKGKLRGEAAKFWVKYGSDDLFDGMTPAIDGSNILGGLQASDPALIFVEEGAAVDTEMQADWFYENMVDNVHRVGNSRRIADDTVDGIAVDGSRCYVAAADAALADPMNCPAVGKRLSAWYDSMALATRTGDSLVLGGKRIEEMMIDSTRPGGSVFNNNRLETAFLSTFQRQAGSYGSAKNGSVAFKPPLYLETKVSFKQMQTPGFRLSIWMMPVESGTFNGAIAYNQDHSDGFEFDIFEFEPVDVLGNGDVCGNAIEFAWINGFFEGRGKAPSGIDGKNNFEGPEEGYCTNTTDSNCTANYNNPYTGTGNFDDDINDRDWNTIGFLWTENAIAWHFNGELVLEITNTAQIPVVPHYLIASREMTNGLLSSAYSLNGEIWQEFLPAEGGLYGWNGNSNIGEFLDKIDQDKAVIDYIKILGSPASRCEYGDGLILRTF